MSQIRYGVLDLGQFDQLIDDGVDRQTRRGVYLQLRGDIAPVRDDGVGRYAERLGDLLVGHALHHADDDLPLAGAQRLGLLVADAVGRQPLDGRNEDVVLHGVVRRQLLLAGEDVEG